MLPNPDTLYRGQLALPAMGAWRASQHVFDDDQRAALWAARAAERPLLVRGEPGTGKSQLAHAAAVAHRWRFIPFVVDSRTEPSDLLWRYDAVARLADAQLGSAAADDDGKPLALRAGRYISPGPLWWAYDPEGANSQYEQCRARAAAPPPLPADWGATHGSVVLIDEIDKAESDVPNALLEALGNGRFGVPLLDRTVQPGTAARTLVIITSNDERELPAAFLRRCMVLTIRLPKGDELIARLKALAQVHRASFPRLTDDHIAAAAQLLADDRAQADAAQYKPGLAEFLDLLRALHGSPGDPMVNLRQLGGFVVNK